MAHNSLKGARMKRPRKRYLVSALAVILATPLCVTAQQPPPSTWTPPVAAEGSSSRPPSVEKDPNVRALDWIIELNKRRAREDAAREAYIAETDALIVDTRERIFDFELTAKEIEFLLKNFECQTARVYQTRMAEKITALSAQQDHISGRCATVDTANTDAVNFCSEQLAETDQKIAEMEAKMAQADSKCAPAQPETPAAQSVAPVEEGTATPAPDGAPAKQAPVSN